MEANDVLVGIDIGGTNTRVAVAAEDGTDLRRLPSDTSDVAAGIVRAFDIAEQVAGQRRIAAAVVGAHGLDSLDDITSVTRELRSPRPGTRIVVVNDAVLLLGCADVEEGTALICGTGSVAVAARGVTEVARAGGWGHLLGDGGSGAGLVIDAARGCLARAESGSEPELVDRILLEGFGIKTAHDLIEAIAPSSSAAEIATHAPGIFAAEEGGCVAARRVLDRGAGELAEITVAATELAGLGGPVAIGGGVVARQPRYYHNIVARIQERRHGTTTHHVTGEPVHGALHIARRLLVDDTATITG